MMNVTAAAMMNWYSGMEAGSIEPDPPPSSIWPSSSLLLASSGGISSACSPYSANEPSPGCSRLTKVPLDVTTVDNDPAEPDVDVVVALLLSNNHRASLPPAAVVSRVKLAPLMGDEVPAAHTLWLVPPPQAVHASMLTVPRLLEEKP